MRIWPIWPARGRRAFKFSSKQSQSRQAECELALTAHGQWRSISRPKIHCLPRYMYYRSRLFKFDGHFRFCDGSVSPQPSPVSSTRYMYMYAVDQCERHQGVITNILLLVPGLLLCHCSNSTCTEGPGILHGRPASEGHCRRLVSQEPKLPPHAPSCSRRYDGEAASRISAAEGIHEMAQKEEEAPARCHGHRGGGAAPHAP